MPNTNNFNLNLIDVFDSVYPIGTLYTTQNEAFNPNNSFVGVWEQVKDRFILACGDEYKIGQTGGLSENKLNGDHMPGSFMCTYQNKTGQMLNTGGIRWTTNNAEVNEWFITEKSSGGILGYDVKYTPLNNLPPYETAYIWKRIS